MNYHMGTTWVVLFNKIKIIMLCWKSIISLKKLQLIQGAHLPTLGLESKTSLSAKGLEEGGFVNPPIGLRYIVV